MNTRIVDNYSRLRVLLFFLPIILLTTIALLLYSRDALCINEYVQIQKSSFLYINHTLGQYSSLQCNLTQLGDCTIILSFLGLLIVYAPKIWESLIAGLLVSFLLTVLLKKVFAIPRPAAVFDSNSFVIIGKKLSGFNSFPSGHSITVFTVLTVLLFAFTSQRRTYKITGFLFVIIIGLLLAFTRVGVGAHYPLDVITGCIIGYISGLSGIFISRRYKICSWVSNKKYYPVFMLFFLSGCIILVGKMISEGLVIFYLSFISLIISLYKIIDVYAFAKNVEK